MPPRPVEGLYGAPVITHVCLETHGLVAHWVGEDKLVVYASTQAVGARPRTSSGGHFKDVPNVKVTCLTQFMGGGFGSKFGPDVQGRSPRPSSRRKAKRPSSSSSTATRSTSPAGTGPRPTRRSRRAPTSRASSSPSRPRLWGTGGHSGGSDFPCPYIYAAAN